MKKGIYINDTIHGLISLSDYEKRIISSIEFNRLHDVYQNSTVYLTFPTNRTKRFEHSIGTMKLCSDMFYFSIANAPKKTINKFYKVFKNEYNVMFEQIQNDTELCQKYFGGNTPNIMPKIVLDKFQNLLIPNNVPKQYQQVHLILIQAIRVAALLHDIGHPPFSHVVENSLKVVYDELANKAALNENENYFKNAMSEYFNEKQLHEQMGDKISKNILESIILRIGENDDSTENLFEVMVLKSVLAIFGNRTPFNYLHNIIDSSIDGDRLDYVTRDAINSGMNYGKIDYKRIINEMCLISNKNEFSFGIPYKCINNVEDFLKRRYNIYKDIINHHRVIKTDYLLKYAVIDLVKSHLKLDNTNDDQERYIIPFNISGLWFPLENKTITERSNALAQWNDSWLITLLKQIYFKKYYKINKSTSKKDKIISYRLSELLRTKKCYYSLIKRSEDFRILDNEILKEINNNRNKIDNVQKELKSASKEKSLNRIPVEIKKFQQNINDILIPQKENKGFIMPKIMQIFEYICEDNILQQNIKSTIKNNIKESLGKEYLDVIIEFKKIKTGINKTIYLIDNKGKNVSLSQVSGISEILGMDSNYLPPFYIYVLLKDCSSDKILNNKNVLLKDIGKKIGKIVVDIILKKINTYKSS